MRLAAVQTPPPHPARLPPPSRGGTIIRTRPTDRRLLLTELTIGLICIILGGAVHAA
jgi:hypothetical protein